MLSSQRKSFSSQEGRGIDQLARRDSCRDPKKPIHGSQATAGPKSSNSPRWKTEIRMQPPRIVRRCTSQLLYYSGQLRFWKAIENEMRDDQIVMTLGSNPR